MKKLAILILILLGAGGSLSAQVIVNPTAGVVTIDASKSASFKVPVSAAVTQVNIINGSPGQQIAIIFQENSVGGFAVAFGTGGPSTISGTCTVATTANTSTTCTANYDITANTWTLNTGGSSSGGTPTPGSPISFGSTVSPLAYGAKWDVKSITDATFTSASNVVTAPNSDMGVTSADLGKLVIGTTFQASETNGCSGSSCGGSLLATPQAFICAINSANSVSLGTSFPGCAADNASFGCVGGGVSQTGTICALVWGTQDDSTAIQNAATAAWGSGNTCEALEFPAGAAFFTVPSGGLLRIAIPNGNPCGTLISDATQTGAMVYGQGMGVSMLVPLPGVSFANCTGGGSGKACIAPPNNGFGHDFSVFGFGQSDNGTTHTNNLLEFNGFGPGCTAQAAWNLSLNNWEAASATSQGFVMNFGCGVQYVSNVAVEAFGNVPCVLSSAGANNNLTVSALDCFGSGGAGAANGFSLIANGPGNINSTGSMYWGGNIVSNSSGAAELLSSVVFNSFGDIFMGPSNATGGAANFGVYMNGGTERLILSGSTVLIPNSAAVQNRAFYCNSAATCNIQAYGATIKSSANGIMFFSNGSTINFYDSCANAFTLGGVANSGTVNIFGSCSITGTPITAAKLVLSAGWGTTAAWSALSGSTQQVFGTITASGTGQAANPTITYTFPTPFLQTPTGCFALQLGGTQAGVAIPFTPSALSATSVTFTYNSTPVAGNTLQVQIQCWNP